MKKTAAIVTIALSLCFSGIAQDLFKDPVQIMRERLSQGRVTMNYYFRTGSDVPVTNKGVMVIEGNCFRADGNGIGICNDGRCQWTIDNKAREVYVEDSRGLEEFFSNPQIYAELLTDLQITDKEISGTYHDGRSGEKTFFKLTDIKAAPAANDSTAFRFDTKDLDSSWLVTDLRERE